MARSAGYDFTLVIDDIAEVFAAPAIDPFSERYDEQSYTSAIEFVANELTASRSLQPVHLTLVLPPGKITPDLEARTLAAVHRYCRAQVVKLDQDLRMARRRIVRSMRDALLAIFALYGLAALLYISPVFSFIAGVLAEGLIIVGWVLLWFPLDEWLSTRHYEEQHRAVYRRLMDMRLVIQPAAEPGAGAPG